MRYPNTLAVLLLTTPPLVAQGNSSSWYLGHLPDGEEKRRFVLDCTGCHQFDSVVVGARRTRDEWAAAVQRMLGYAGARSNFPVISAYRDTAPTAEWLAAALASPRPTPQGFDRPAAAAGDAEITEFELSTPQDLLHDLAIDSLGRVIVTGMFSARMFVLDPATRRSEEIATPAPQPRAVEIDRAGRWWVLLGARASWDAMIPVPLGGRPGPSACTPTASASTRGVAPGSTGISPITRSKSASWTAPAPCARSRCRDILSWRQFLTSCVSARTDRSG